MVGWHHWVDEFDHVPGVGDGWGSPTCCSPWGLKESDMTEWLNWTELLCANIRTAVVFKCFLCTSIMLSILHLFAHHNNPTKWELLLYFINEKNWGSERLSILSKNIQLVKQQNAHQLQVGELQRPGSFHSITLYNAGHQGLICCCCCCLVAKLWTLMTPWTVAHQVPLSMGFPR